MKKRNRILVTAIGMAVLIALGAGLAHLSERGASPSAVAQSSDAGSGAGGADAQIFVGLAKKAVPAVVNIFTFSQVQNNRRGGGSQEEMFRRFFEKFFNGPTGPGVPPGDGDEEDSPRTPRSGGKGLRPMALGSGFVIEESGYILTNNHVIQGADEVKVNFTEDTNEKPTDAKIVGRDPELDLALLKVNVDRKLHTLPLGNSDALEVGEYVMAVGNPFNQGHTVTHGIISAKGRKAPENILASYLQTDAPINPGNSGGPLINLNGEVIGINNAIDARARGTGFAIPINMVKAVLPQLKSKGSVSRGYIGIGINELTPEIAEKIGAPKDLTAPFAAEIYPGEPAAKAGMKAYDVIVEVNGKKVTSAKDLVENVTMVPVGEKAAVKVLRGGKEVALSIKVGERPNGERENAPKDAGENSDLKDPAETGMVLKDFTRDGEKGVAVAEIEYDGPADRAGLLRGDIIVEVDRKAVRNRKDFFAIVKKGSSYLVRVKRMDPMGRAGYTVVVLDLK